MMKSEGEGQYRGPKLRLLKISRNDALACFRKWFRVPSRVQPRPFQQLQYIATSTSQHPHHNIHIHIQFILNSTEPSILPFELLLFPSHYHTPIRKHGPQTQAIRFRNVHILLPLLLTAEWYQFHGPRQSAVYHSYTFTLPLEDA